MSPAEIKARLQEVFPDGTVEVVDLTGTQDHYEVTIASRLFAGLSRIQCQRNVMDAVDAELKSGEVHALTIKTTALGRSPLGAKE